MTGLKELIGRRCRIEFTLDPFEWPIPGFPAWADVNDVDMPMIKLDDMWVNVSIIKRIEAW